MVASPAMAGWPDVPACYGWLALDRRGHWRLQGERLAHSGLISFLNQHYGCDEAGRWFVQNGPQRVFVTLACTPWIVRLSPDGLVTHTGRPAGQAQACFIDEAGNILLLTEPGIALLDDRDLLAFTEDCTLSGAALMTWHGLCLQPIRQGDIARQFSFQPDPRP